MAETFHGRIRVLEASAAILGPDSSLQIHEGCRADDWRGDAGLTAFRCEGEDDSARECEIVFPQSAYQQVVEHLSQDVSRECGGFLLGHETAIGESNYPAVVIDRAVPAQHTEGTPVRLTFTTDSWRDLDQITDRLRLAGRLVQRVGWYHSHPALSIFLSRWDLDVCKTFDRRRYPVALVVDPVGHLGGFFVRGKEGYRPQSPQGFCELHDLKPASIVTWSNVVSVGTVGGPDQPSAVIEQADSAQNKERIDEPLPVETSRRQPGSERDPELSFSKRASARFAERAALIALSLLVIGGFWFQYANQQEVSKSLAQLAAEVGALKAVSVSPSAASLLADQSQTFKAGNVRDNREVRWSVTPELGVVSPEGVYTAPRFVSGEQIVTIKATSQDDSKNFGTATVRLLPPVAVVSVTISPRKSELAPGQRQEFKTTVMGSENDEVSWSMMPAIGTISSEGVYIAPSAVLARQTVIVTATSTANPDKSATALVTLKIAAQQVSVKVEPHQATLGAAATEKFTAKVTGIAGTVTWTLEGDGEMGEISETGEYTAPSQVLKSKTFKVRATSTADPKKSGIATITLEPPDGDSIRNQE